MNSNEEYLDSLLKSISDNDKKKEDNNSIMTPEEIEAMFEVAEKVAGGESVPLESKEDMFHQIEEDHGDMSSDDIVKLLEEAENSDVGDSNSKEETDNTSDYAAVNDLDMLLQNLNFDNEISDIGDIDDLLKINEDETPAYISESDANDIHDLFSGDENTDHVHNVQEEKDNRKKERKKKFKLFKKKSTESNPNNNEQNISEKDISEQDMGIVNEYNESKEKRKSFLIKLITTLMAEDDTNEEVRNENSSLTGGELEEQKESKKKKKSKKDKGTSNGNSKKNAGDEEDDDTKKTGNKKLKKAAKKSKPKKAKEPKDQKVESFEIPPKKISKKSIFVIFLFSGSIFVAILFGIDIGSSFIQKNNAEKAFERHDYLTCYEQLYGLELTDKQANMFNYAEVVLKLQRRIDMYDRFMNEYMELEALDSLLQAVEKYDELYAKAQSYGAHAEVAELYNKILNILTEDYDITEEEARAIVDCPSNVEYTRYLTALVNGEQVSSDENGEGIILPKQELEDVLPAEEELNDSNFMD